MKKIAPFIIALILISLVAESCGTERPPKSTGHKSYRQSRKNR